MRAIAACLAACLIVAGCKRQSAEIQAPTPKPATIVLYNPLDCPLVDDDGRVLRASLYASGGGVPKSRACLYEAHALPAQELRRFAPSR